MSDFCALPGQGCPENLPSVLGAPALLLGQNGFCGRTFARHGRVLAHLSGRLLRREALSKALLGAGAALPPRPTDDELLLHAYLTWDETCYEHLEGPAAALILDGEQNKLIASRDPMGECPVFYTDGAVSDRAETLLALPGVDPVIGADGLCELFALGPARTPGRTPFEAIRELESGCALIMDSRGRRLHRYFRLEARRHEDSLPATVDRVRGLLEEAVAPMRALSPLCMLSGGLDSTYLTALCGGGDSFCVDYEDNHLYFAAGSPYQRSEDAPWAQRAAEMLRCRHTAVTLTKAQLADALPAAREARFFPGMADVDSSLLLFCHALARRGKWAISGECADEVFGGYPWFHRPELIESDLFPWSGSMALRGSILKPALREKLSLSEYARDSREQVLRRLPALPGESPRETRLRALQGLCFAFFMPVLQERALRMGQKAHLNILTPFADAKLAQYVYNVPWEMKNAGGMEKGLLRMAAEGVLPDALRMRRKSPYPKTYHPEYGRTIAVRCMETLRREDSPLRPLLDMDEVERLCAGALSPRDTPWFGQLMTLPQMLGYLIQTDDFLRASRARIRI